MIVPKKTNPKTSAIKGLIAALVIVAVLLIGVSAWVLKTHKIPYLPQLRLDENKYYAVFLSNGQVYFGHLKYLHTRYPVLTDIYYLQTAQSPQPQPAKEGEEIKEEEKKPELTLVKLGEELHGPQDSMTLNRDHILFVEELKDDGKVVQAIKEYKKK